MSRGNLFPDDPRPVYVVSYPLPEGGSHRGPMRSAEPPTKADVIESLKALDCYGEFERNPTFQWDVEVAGPFADEGEAMLAASEFGT